MAYGGIGKIILPVNTGFIRANIGISYIEVLATSKNTHYNWRSEICYILMRGNYSFTIKNCFNWK